MNSPEVTESGATRIQLMLLPDWKSNVEMVGALLPMTRTDWAVPLAGSGATPVGEEGNTCEESETSARRRFGLGAERDGARGGSRLYQR